MNRELASVEQTKHRARQLADNESNGTPTTAPDYQESEAFLRCSAIWNRRANQAADEIRRLRVWIRRQSDVNDTCTFNVLGEVCEGCSCGKLDMPNV